MVLDTLEAIAGALLVFLLPGLAWSRALFPEWRLRGELAITRAVETATLAVLLSIGSTILVGFLLTAPGAGGFSARWSDPTLEAALGALTLVGAVVAYLRGGFDRVPPAAPVLEPAPGADSPEPMLLELERLRRRERYLRRELRRRDLSAGERARLDSEHRTVEARTRELEQEREAQYVG
jgi:hypothetical protein